MFVFFLLSKVLALCFYTLKSILGKYVLVWHWFHSFSCELYLPRQIPDLEFCNIAGFWFRLLVNTFDMSSPYHVPVKQQRKFENIKYCAFFSKHLIILFCPSISYHECIKNIYRPSLCSIHMCVLVRKSRCYSVTSF